MPTTNLDKVTIKGLTEETGSKPILVWNPATRRVSWQTSPNSRIAALEAKLDPNNNFKFIPEPGFTFDNSTRVLTMKSGWIGTINGIDYTNETDIVLPAISLAVAGYSRIDLIVFTTSGTFEIVPGRPTAFNAVAPQLPINTLEATFLTVNNTAVTKTPIIPKPQAPVTSVNGLRGDVLVPYATPHTPGTVSVDATESVPMVYTKKTVDNLLEGKANYFLDIKTITGITYNVILTDILNELVYAGTLPMNVIIPNNSTVPFPIGSMFYTLGTNSGIITASGAAGVTLNVKAGISLSAIQNEVRQYTKIGVNTWSVRGDLNLGAVTQQELSYLQGATSNLQAQINAKTALSGGIVNYLMKWATATTATVSRIWDTGTFLGIGTANTPTKDLTFGNQANREIGVEDSNNETKGRDLIISSGRTIDYINNTAFNIIPGSLIANFVDIDIAPNGDVVVMGHDSSLFAKPLGSETFSYIGGTGAYAPTFTITANNDIYIAARNWHIVKQTNRTGAFVLQNNNTNIAWRSITSTKSNDIWACGSNKIFKQINGIGEFIDQEFPDRNYMCLESDNFGNIYVAVYGGDIYKITNGIMNALGQTARGWSCLERTPSNKMIALVEGSNIYYVQDSGVGNFIASSNILPISSWAGQFNIACDSNNSLYLQGYTSPVYFQNNNAFGASNLDGGKLKLYAGTGKGTGSSRQEFYTGQKSASGTNMQAQTLRMIIDEEGLVALPSTSRKIIDGDTSGKALITKEKLENQTIAASLLAEYKFEESVKTIVLDSSGNGKNGTYVGTPNSVSGGGFYAENGKYATGHVDALATAQTIYMCVDISPDNINLYHSILGNSTGLANLNILGTEPSNGNPWQGAHISGNGKNTITFQPAPTNAYIIAITIDNAGGVSPIYLNGEEVKGYFIQNTLMNAVGRAGIPWFGQTNENGVGYLNANIYYFSSYSSLHTEDVVRKNSDAIRKLLNQRGTKKPESYNINSNDNQLLIQGDSITSGFGGTVGFSNDIATIESFNKIKKGWAGISSTNCLIASYGFPTLYPCVKGINIAVLFFGTNDAGAITATQSVKNIRASSEFFKKAGWKVIVCTLLDRGDAQGLANPTFYTDFNTKVRNSWGYFADGLADLNANANLGNVGASNNTTYFQADKVHPTNAGEILIAGIVSNAINKITEGI